MIQATRWRQDNSLQPTNPYQRIRFFATFPGQAGDSAFAWSPVAANAPGGITPVDFSPASGVSGALQGALAGLGLSLDFASLAKGLAAIGGIFAGAWLAKKNLEG